jgi:O-antigen/teichoic acid export membrane protein
MVFLSLVARAGVNVYLLRCEDTPSEAMYNQAFSFLLLSGISLGGLGLAAAPALGYWFNDDRFFPPLRVLLLVLPLTALSVPAVARLERALDYRSVAALELGQQLLFLIVALVLAWHGLGVWAPVAGYCASQVWMIAGSHALAGFWPRWHWSPALLREMLAYGLGYSASAWVWQLRELVNPLVVGRYAGAEAVGYVALVVRLVDTLGFVSGAIWRISIVALARLQRNRARLLDAVSEGMGLQVLASGPILAGFGWVAPMMLPVLLGPNWLPALAIYPFVALSHLAISAFSLYSSALYVLRRNWEVTRFHLAHVGLLAGAALLLVPRLGPIGYGWAEIVALGSYLVLHSSITAHIGRPEYAPSFLWLIAFSVPVFGISLGPWVWLAILVPLLWSASRRQVLGAAAIVIPQLLRRLPQPRGAS